MKKTCGKCRKCRENDIALRINSNPKSLTIYACPRGTVISVDGKLPRKESLSETAKALYKMFKEKEKQREIIIKERQKRNLTSEDLKLLNQVAQKVAFV